MAGKNHGKHYVWKSHQINNLVSLHWGQRGLKPENNGISGEVLKVEKGLQAEEGCSRMAGTQE